MIPAELEKAIEKAIAAGQKPFLINATCGTTVLGAYDDIVALSAIAKKHHIWLHVDAAWGGHCLLSAKHRHLMKGAEHADSVTFTATKCFGLPQQCAMLLLPKRQTLQCCYASNEDYLFHEHDEKDWDLGERSLNCGRRVDCFKLWVSWKVYGDEGYAARVDHAFENAQHIAHRIKADPESFRLLVEPESLNINFWFVPKSARALPDSPEKFALMDRATLDIRRALQLAGKCLVNFSDLPGVQGHFFRMISCNPNATKADMDFVVDHIKELGQTLAY
jgi:glutamate/tyrosine decarboxylase-like PLP-dependent enzyme